MPRTNFNVGDIVEDKFKMPKAGDVSIRGEVVEVGDDLVVVQWERAHNPRVEMNLKTAGSLLRKVAREGGDGQ